MTSKQNRQAAGNAEGTCLSCFSSLSLLKCTQLGTPGWKPVCKATQEAPISRTKHLQIQSLRIASKHHSARCPLATHQSLRCWTVRGRTEKREKQEDTQMGFASGANLLSPLLAGLASPLSQSAQAAVTKHHKLGALTNTD